MYYSLTVNAYLKNEPPPGIITALLNVLRPIAFVPTEPVIGSIPGSLTIHLCHHNDQPSEPCQLIATYPIPTTPP